MIDTTSPYLNQQGGDKNKKIAAYIAIVVIIAALIVSIFIFRQPKKTDQVKVDIVEKKEPSPTEKPKIDKGSVKIQVLNGTGTSGQAGITVEALKKAGYSSDNIKTANAKDFNNTVTTISAKDSYDDVASDVKDALKTTFDEIEIDSTHLGKDSEFDVIVITGGKKIEATSTPAITTSQSPTPSPTTAVVTATPTPTLTPTSSPTSTP
jgi:hypothetical protein